MECEVNTNTHTISSSYVVSLSFIYAAVTNKTKQNTLAKSALGKWDYLSYSSRLQYIISTKSKQALEATVASHPRAE